MTLRSKKKNQSINVVNVKLDSWTATLFSNFLISSLPMMCHCIRPTLFITVRILGPAYMVYIPHKICETQKPTCCIHSIELISQAPGIVRNRQAYYQEQDV